MRGDLHHGTTFLGCAASRKIDWRLLSEGMGIHREPRGRGFNDGHAERPMAADFGLALSRSPRTGA
jgi:hypothetical protein